MAESDSSMEKAEGFLAGIGSSLRHHIDERLKSPFGGAFVIAWLAINWKPILLIFLSSEPIEKRIAEVATEYSWQHAVLWPVLLSIGIAVGFYLLSALFLVIHEFYEWIRDFVRRRFDRVRWISPSRYIDLKSRYGEKIQYYQGLASDNLDELARERAKSQEAAEKLLAAQIELGNATGALAGLTEEKAQFLSDTSKKQSEINLLMNRIRQDQSQLADLTKEIGAIDNVLKEVLVNLDESLSILRGTIVATDPLVWNKLLSVRTALTTMMSKGPRMAG